MKVLGISGKERDAAAAIAVDGAVVAAAAEESFARVPRIGYRHTGGYPLAAIEACLTRAGLTLSDVDRLLVVSDGRTVADEVVAEGDHLFHDNGHQELRRTLAAMRPEALPPLVADARQLAAATGGDLIAVVMTPECAQSAVFLRHGAELTPISVTLGVQALNCAIRQVASVLMPESAGRYEALEDLASTSNAGPVGAFDEAMRWSDDHGVAIDMERLEGIVSPFRPSTSGAAEPAGHVRLQQARSDLAVDFCACVQTLVVRTLGALATRVRVPRVGLAGTLAASRGISSAAAHALGSAFVGAPVPEPSGRALGAALDGHATPAPLDSLALGPHFSEEDIKAALENCRLDYLYEPDWARLLARTSRLLAQGSVVAWFQGATGFGPRSIGTRAILCDPSNRYARENVNRFLRGASIDDPLPLAMTAAAIDSSTDNAVASAFVPTASSVKAEWRDRLRAAIDPRGTAPIQAATHAQSPALIDLLDLHRERTGVPGLISLPLAGRGELSASSPREAVRTMYSSAIDALVIGRFLLMKDYWLLRTGAEA